MPAIKVLFELTPNQVEQILYCMESMASDYTDETTEDYKDWSSALEALQEPLVS
tara:strand:- start:646 stop:807 length:162 start_codon:yes stop_codon:yes gene_type:complete